MMLIEWGLVSAILVSFAGCMAGCTISLTSLDEDELLANSEMAEEGDRKAQFIKRSLGHPWMRRRKHWLMVTLMLCNAAANEALPICLNKIFSPEVSIILSVTCVLIFGEILPSAVMTGPKQLVIAARLAPAVRLLMLATGLVSFPIAKALDLLLGINSSKEHGDFRSYDRKHLMLKLRKQLDRQFLSKDPAIASNLTPMLGATANWKAQHRKWLTSGGDGRLQRAPKPTPPVYERKPSFIFHDQEWDVLQRLPTLASKTVSDLLHPHNTWEKVNKVGERDVIDEKWMATVQHWGHSRLPVVACDPDADSSSDEEKKADPRSFSLPPIGFLLLMDLLHVNPHDHLTLCAHNEALACLEGREGRAGSEGCVGGGTVLRAPLVVSVDTPILDMLRLFKSGAAHIALVTRSREEVQAVSVLRTGKEMSEENDSAGDDGAATSSRHVIQLCMLDRDRAAEAQARGRVSWVGMVTLEDVMVVGVNEYSPKSCTHAYKASCAMAHSPFTPPDFQEELVGEIYDETDEESVHLYGSADLSPASASASTSAPASNTGFTDLFSDILTARPTRPCVRPHRHSHPQQQRHENVYIELHGPTEEADSSGDAGNGQTENKQEEEGFRSELLGLKSPIGCCVYGTDTADSF